MYAERTSVSPERSVAELRATLQRFGADGFGYAEELEPHRAMEFLADLVLPSGRVVHEELAPRLEAWETSGEVVALIPETSSRGRP